MARRYGAERLEIQHDTLKLLKKYQIFGLTFQSESEFIVRN